MRRDGGPDTGAVDSKSHGSPQGSSPPCSSAPVQALEPQAPSLGLPTVPWQASGDQRDSAAAEHCVASAPQTPPGAPVVTSRAEAIPAASPATKRIGQRLPAGSLAADGGEGPTARACARSAGGACASDVVTCRREALQPTPQATAGSPTGGAGSCGSRLKRRHAETAADGAALAASAAVSPRISGSRGSRGSVSRSPSPAKAAAQRGAAGASTGTHAELHHSSSSAANSRRDGSLAVRPPRAARQLVSGTEQPRQASNPRVASHAAGKESPAVRRSAERGLSVDRNSPAPLRCHAPLQPLQTPSIADKCRSSISAAAGLASGGRSSITIDATSEVLRVAGRLRAVSAERGRNCRRQRSPSVEDDLDEVTAILNQLRHR